MRPLGTFLMPFLLHALSWALVHSLWQIAFIAVLLAVALALIPKHLAGLRHLMAAGALLLMLLVPLGTGIRIAFLDQSETRFEDNFSATPITEAILNPVNNVPNAVDSSPLGWAEQRLQIERLQPWIILIWLTGVIVLSARLTGAWIYSHQLRQRHTKPLVEKWQRRRFQDLAWSLRVTKPVAILESSLVNVPLVIGWLYPAILLPVAALITMTPRELEAVIAHELAHIRRRDYLFNIFQSVSEILLFYHPAAWWVSRRMRIEREYACDDMAATVCDKLLYARALTQVERLRKATQPRLAMAANGGMLLNRVRRLVEPVTPQSSPIALLLVGLLILTTTLAAGMIRASQLSLFSQAKVRSEQPLNADDAKHSTLLNYTVSTVPNFLTSDASSLSKKPQSKIANQKRVPRSRKSTKSVETPSGFEGMEQLINFGDRSLDLADKAQKMKGHVNSKPGAEINTNESRQASQGQSPFESVEQLMRLGSRSLDLADKARTMKAQLKAKNTKPQIDQ